MGKLKAKAAEFLDQPVERPRPKIHDPEAPTAPEPWEQPEPLGRLSPLEEEVFPLNALPESLSLYVRSISNA